MNIREITPCIECPRNCKPARFDESDSVKAASFLVVKALEKTADSEPTATLQNDAEQIQRTCNTRYTTKNALNAIGKCGSKIGSGECEAWQVDPVHAAVRPKNT